MNKKQSETTEEKRQLWSQFGVMEDRVLTKMRLTNQLIALHCIVFKFSNLYSVLIYDDTNCIEGGTVDGELSGHLLLYMNCHMERRERWILKANPLTWICLPQLQPRTGRIADTHMIKE